AAARATAKTVKGLALRTNCEGRRFFLMKWTERLKTCTRPLQRKIGSDHFHDVVRGRDLLDCFRRDRHFSLVPGCLPWQTYRVSSGFQIFRKIAPILLCIATL